MNLRAHPPRPADARWAGLRLVLWLFPGVAISASSVAPESFGPVNRPYLTAVGSPALRFGEAPPPPPLWVRPAAAAPPLPESAAHVDTPHADSTASPAVEADAPTPTPSADVIAPPGPAPAAKTPAPILPDDTRQKVRAEDFLPFFHFPGSAPSAGDVTVVTPAVPTNAPTPATMPSSSATYRQQ